MDDEIDDYQVREPAHQLCRYGGKPFSEHFYAALWGLADLNDDLHHMRSRECIEQSAGKAKAAIDAILNDALIARRTRGGR